MMVIRHLSSALLVGALFWCLPVFGQTGLNGQRIQAGMGPLGGARFTTGNGRGPAAACVALAFLVLRRSEHMRTFSRSQSLKSL